MKKLLAALLCVVMVVSLFAGCNQNTPATTTKPAATNPPATSGKVETTASTAAPTTEAEPVTITIALPQKANVLDYENNALTKWLEETCNVNIEIMKLQSATSDYKAQISTMLLDDTAKLPDMYYAVNLGASLYTQYGQDGYIMDLTPYFEDKEKSATFWERMEILKADDPGYYDHILYEMKSEDGGQYAFPTVSTDYGDTVRYRCFINQDWLDYLKLEMPKDLDSLYNVLVAFRDGDPNQNGLADELPLFGRMGNQGFPVDWISNMFIYEDPHLNWFSVGDDGKLYLPHITDAYRQSIIFVNKLIKEGLMPESVFSNKSADVKSVLNVDDPKQQKVGILLGHPTTFFDLNCEAILSYEAMPYWGNIVLAPHSHSFQTYISTTSENPDKAWEILMALFSWEGSHRTRYGEKGVNWKEADPNTFGPDGRPATIQLIGTDPWSSNHSQHWSTATAAAIFWTIDTVLADTGTATPMQAQKNKIAADNEKYAKEAELNNNPKNIMPELIYTQAENDLTADLRQNCKDFIKSVRANFCAGTGEYNDPSDDAQWAKFIDELNKMGLPTWIKQAQMIYDRSFG